MDARGEVSPVAGVPAGNTAVRLFLCFANLWRSSCTFFCLSGKNPGMPKFSRLPFVPAFVCGIVAGVPWRYLFGKQPHFVWQIVAFCQAY